MNRVEIGQDMAIPAERNVLLCIFHIFQNSPRNFIKNLKNMVFADFDAKS